MALEVDYLPFAASGIANVDTQADYAGSGYQENGFTAGSTPAQSKQLNKVWRQASMIAAALANIISAKNNTNLLDDGNLDNLITLMGLTILPAQTIDLTPVTVNANTTAEQNLMSYTIAANAFAYVGKTLRFTAAGTFSAVASQSISLGQSIGGSSPAGGAAFNVGSSPISTAYWFQQCIITCLTTGASGSVNVLGATSLGTTGLTAASLASFFTLNLNLTTALTLQFETAFSVANTSNSVTQNQLIVEALN